MKIAKRFFVVLLMMTLIVTVVFSSAMARDNDRGISFDLFSSGSSGGFSGGGGGGGGGGGARSVPEPSTLILLASGVGGLILVRRIRTRK